MYKEIFTELNLSVVELPVEMTEDKPHYTVYLREIPTLTGEGFSLQEAYRQLAEKYAAYREAHKPENTDEVATDFTLAELLRYYDGETIDGFSDYF
ncbi:hypothetical protein M2139_000715 [Enterococcus sp. PF1-24]|uniref:hypothetical protein n=1 Tax=unclassified Enterococcus TaxID=2608891 RepID=UPI002473352D|nr:MULTISPECIES: hypothetical protein [unclassified Enterococcus]MDH6363598.1 hypothetical protein [Enterococcus sp. PFB1-1]MDH6400833.1 hypothetical protein [Enterococcus sp. PF1-24]